MNRKPYKNLINSYILSYFDFFEPHSFLNLRTWCFLKTMKARTDKLKIFNCKSPLDWTIVIQIIHILQAMFNWQSQLRFDECRGTDFTCTCYPQVPRTRNFKAFSLINIQIHYTKNVYPEKLQIVFFARINSFFSKYSH